MAIHVVQRGENLWLISNLYNIPISKIVQVNGLITADALVPGLALYIPDEQLPIRYYQIKPGDSLWKLAQRFNTRIPTIVGANEGMDLSTLYINERLNIPSPNKLTITTLGFVLPYAPNVFLTRFDALADQLTYLAVAAFTLTDEGYAYNELADQAIVLRSRERNVIPLLMIRNLKNGLFSPELIGQVLENPIYRNNLVRSLVQLTRERGYGGVSIDFEFIPPLRREDFIIFLRDLKLGLGGQILHVNVHAKSADLPLNLIVGGYDYAAIGAIADIVAVMTIDYGYPTGPPEPIAPLWWVEQVIRYAISLIAPEKLQIAFALYGYDKIVGTNVTQALSVQGAQNQAISVGSSIQFDLLAQSPWYQYWRGLDEHIVWFEDIRSYVQKYRLIDVYQLLGATYWQIGLPAPQNWAFLEDNLQIRKLLSS